MTQNKKKIINDPVYGFIRIPYDIIFDIIEHPYFQRLRRIKQLGLTNLVYPGAIHTRFHHAIGSMHLMGISLEVLRSKGIEITEDEAKAALIAILLHDIGHGPYSHALEHAIVKNTSHESLSSLFMQHLNSVFNNQLQLAIAIFNNTYKRKFFHQLVSSQLDMDRMDYLTRDSFFTGVSEGIISWDRILYMLNVNNDKLVIDSKGIYSIEKFLISRRLMYWQVYMHKTVISAEFLLIQILKRANFLAHNNISLPASPQLGAFIYNNYTIEHFKNQPDLLHEFAELDDYDIFSAIKSWKSHNDKILSILCNCLINRKLMKVEIQNTKPAEKIIENYKAYASKYLKIDLKDSEYFVHTGEISNNAYDPSLGQILILYKNQETKDIALASDNLNIKMLSTTVKKHFIYFYNL